MNKLLQEISATGYIIPNWLKITSPKFSPKRDDRAERKFRKKKNGK